VYAIGLAHFLGPRLYGLFSYGISWYLAFLPIAGLGLGVILSREIGQNRSQAARVASQTLTLRFLSAIVVAIFCGTVAWFSEGEPRIRKLLLVFSFALIGRALALWTEQAFTACEKNKYSFWVEAIFRPAEMVIGLWLLFAGFGIVAVAIVHTVVWWLQAFTGLAFARRYIGSLRFDLAWHSLKKMLVQGLPIALGVLLVGWLQQGPLLLFRFVAGAGKSLGQLAFAMQAFFVLAMIPAATGTASLPALSRAVGTRDGKDRLFAETMLRAALIIGAAAGLAGIAVGRRLVDIILGPHYAEAGHLLGPAMWLLIPWTCGTAIWRVFLAKGRFFLPILCGSAGALVLTSTLPMCVSSMDTAGALFATGAGMAVWAISLVWFLARSEDLDFRQAILRPCAAILPALGVFFVLKPITVWLALPASWVAILGGTLFFGVLTPKERSNLIGLLGWRSSSSRVEP
jgi:O-antigen/teichoic acid export membrane protein